jgi:hypothetical protein
MALKKYGILISLHFCFVDSIYSKLYITLTGKHVVRSNYVVKSVCPVRMLVFIF